MSQRRVIIESPYAGDIGRNERYARAAVRDSLLRGEAPYASHLLYTQPGVLNDADSDERRLGMLAGFAWGEGSEATVVYEDLGISSGMQAGIERAKAAGRPVEYRRIPGWLAAGAGPGPSKARFQHAPGHEGPGTPEGPRARPASGARPARRATMPRPPSTPRGRRPR